MMAPAPFYPEIAEGPDNGSCFWVGTGDGLRLRVGYWKATGRTKGTIFLFPGRTEYVELQGRTAKSFADRGFSICTIDWRGHGLSDRVLSNPVTLHVNRFSDYQYDVAAIIAAASAVDMPKPWFLLGNSMGGCIGLRALLSGVSFSACAFTAPMWGLRMSRVQSVVARPVSWAAQVIGQGERYVPGHDGNNYALSNPFEGNRITRDPTNYEYWVSQARSKPCLQTAGSSMQWLHQSLLECGHLSKTHPPDVPCIAFCGEQDGVVDIEVIRDRMNAWPNGRFELMPGARHALLLEVPKIRETVISEISDHFESIQIAV
ncbi:alpha/beta hydrolase [Primorskyibacter sp. 2E233]|uniref:alpha/beta hydrolase n=1 Tax=Primorskyibacter sp. 2E233 TaxID=3413431 RepID=UPI003BF22FB3